MQTDDIRVQDDLMDYFDLHALQDKLDRELPADYQHYIDHLPGATMFDIPAEPAHQDRKDMFLASLVQSNASKLLPLAHEQPQFRFEIQHLPPSGVAALDFQEGSPLELVRA